ncbi:MAG: glycosyltransferase family 2 protein [Muribaculaceae bacterium]|nr:glycosyltransferase family 2 protein [Muribaculaceae bacterium]
MITASIVFYNTSLDEVRAVLDCLENSPVDKVYVIDHSDTDKLKNISESFSKVRYEIHPNGGYGKGHNHGIRKALDINTDYHIIINPDIYWKGDVIERLRDFMDTHPDCGLVMPKVLFPNGEIQYLCKLLPTPMDLIGRRFIPLKNYTRRHNENYELRWSGYDRVMEVPSLSGCFMFIRGDVLRKTGGFDERFFLYAEDMDLCRRIGEVSLTVFNPEVTIYHAYHQDSYKNFKHLKMHINSVIKYFNKWGWLFDRKRKDKNRRCIEKLRDIRRKSKD